MNLAAARSTEIGRSPIVIAAEINSIKQHTRMIMVQSAIEIGRRLTEAKSLVPHGEWGTWLEINVEYSQSTANNFMRIAEEYGNSQVSLFDAANSQAIANLSYTQAIALLAIPAYERAEFIEENKAGELSTRELQQLIKERDEAKAKLEAAEKSARQVAQEKSQTEAAAALLRADVQATEQVLKDTQGRLNALQDALAVERQKSKAEVDRLTKELQAAHSSGESTERLQQLEQDLAEAQRQVKQLTEEVNKPVTLEPAVVERVPAEVEQELNTLREQAKKYKDSEATLKFRIQFDAQVKGFQTLLSTLKEIQTADPEAYEQYRKAMAGLLERMTSAL